MDQTVLKSPFEAPQGTMIPTITSLRCNVFVRVFCNEVLNLITIPDVE